MTKHSTTHWEQYLGTHA